MLGLVRTAISLLFLSLLVWCSFAVPLGTRTLAEHVDRIGETREARDLIKGARERINPVLEEAKGRLLGEYVEAPTYAAPESPAGRRARQRDTRSAVLSRTASTAPASKAGATKARSASTAEASRLPGRTKRAQD
ncbi:MAG: hypothetical protein R3A79_07115 [Nannocystaceae bacterium]